MSIAFFCVVFFLFLRLFVYFFTLHNSRRRFLFSHRTARSLSRSHRREHYLAAHNNFVVLVALMDVDCSQRVCTNTTGRVLFLAVKLSTITMANEHIFSLLLFATIISIRARRARTQYVVYGLLLFLILSHIQNLRPEDVHPYARRNRNDYAIRTEAESCFCLLRYSAVLVAVFTLWITVWR